MPYNHTTSHDHDRVRRYAGERCLPERVIERHSGLTPRVMFWRAISYHGRSNLLRIPRNLNSHRYVPEVLQPEVVIFLQGIPGAMFQQDNVCPHVLNTFRVFCSAQHMKLFSWPAYSSDMSPIEHVWDFFVGASLLIRAMQLQNMNFCCAYKKYGVVLHKQTFKICLTLCHVV
ncbi:transposable element Tc1 transposase [Trichonephila clavipes]|nr:transposable element Tc1 transposase [Trichonephila clavipes]